MDETNLENNTPGFTPSIQSDYILGLGKEESNGDTVTPTGDDKPKGDEADSNGEAPSDDKKSENAEDTPKEGETPKPEDETKAIVESWKEDRNALSLITNENRALKDEISQLKERLSTYEPNEEEEEDEFEGLTKEQKEAKIVERHEQKIREKQESIKKEVEDEIAFHRKTSKDFRENEKDILKIAESFNVKSLDQAEQIFQFKKQVEEATRKLVLAEEERKRTASNSQSTAPNTTQSKGYDPKNDGKKSYMDIFMGK